MEERLLSLLGRVTSARGVVSVVTFFDGEFNCFDREDESVVDSLRLTFLNMLFMSLVVNVFSKKF
jgi:hypothetical protein